MCRWCYKEALEINSHTAHQLCFYQENGATLERWFSTPAPPSAMIFSKDIRVLKYHLELCQTLN